MIRPQTIFRRAVEGLKRVNNSRKLYTDSIYPYPYKYFNEIVHPTQYSYRETFIMPKWVAKQNKTTKWLFRIFWTHWWYMAFSHPEVFKGHFHPPDTNLWTDEELGIPPLEEGSYEDWKLNQLEASSM